MKRSRPNPISKTERRKYELKLNRMIRARVMQRDNYTCVRCGRSEYQGYKVDWSHVITRANKAVCWDEDNSKALCYLCHDWFGKSNGWGGAFKEEGEGIKWFREKYPDRYARLLEKRHLKGPNPKQLYEELSNAK